MTAIPLDCPATGTKDGSREFAFADDERVVVSFRHTGDAPVLRQSKFKLPAKLRFHEVASLLRQHLQLQPTDSLFLFCNSSFAPQLDQLLGDVAACFHVDGGTLVLNYCTTPAWG
uniref:Ubiquitin-like protein ATG12 n=1 Tax=Chrysotila carterae TaxID=13221 RepID=A0A7S4C2C5_CHRCT